MYNLKNLILIVLLAVACIGCGTDGLDVKEQPLSFANANDIPDFIFAGQQYSFTLNVEEGTATNANLTSFTTGGNWLTAQIVNNGSGIELTGTPSNSDAFTEFSYDLNASGDGTTNRSVSFTVFVAN